MTTTTKQTLQAEIAGSEKAIRLLIGEERALHSKLARAEARLKLAEARLRALIPGTLPTASRFPDVSNNNAQVNVAQVRQARGVRVGDLLMTKLTEGGGFIDRPGVTRLGAMSKAGFPHRGVYAFLHPSLSGTEQATFLLKVLSDAKISLGAGDVVAGDLEVSDGQSGPAVRSCAKEFGLEIAKHLQVKRWLYGGGPFLKEFGVTLDGYDAHWLAAYVQNPAPFMVFGKAKTVAWQFTDGRFGPGPHACPGIGPCDLSIVL